MYFTRAAEFAQPIRVIAQRLRHTLRPAIRRQKSLKFPLSFADTAGKPKSRLGWREPI
jgi:hypothetical protein